MARVPGEPRPRLPGALDQAVADAATFFESEVPVIVGSAFAEADARRIPQPVLVVLGGRSAALHPRFAETYRLLLEWLPDAEGLVLPGAAHFLQIEYPRGVADALTSFWTRRPPGA